MPTKPSDNPLQWATGGNYPPSVYPALLPWGAAHPDAGNPTPWSNTARTDAGAAYTAQAAAGYVPLEAEKAEAKNEHMARLTDLCRWVFDGSSAGAADAHIVETDGAGKTTVNAASVTATLDVGGTGEVLFDVAGGAIQFGSGVGLPIVSAVRIVSGTTTLGGSSTLLHSQMSVVGASGGIINGDANSSFVWSGAFTMNSEIVFNLSVPTTNGAIGANSSDFFELRRGGTNRLIHDSASGAVRASGQDDDGSGGAAVATYTLDTTSRVKPQAGDLRVTANFWARRASAGGITVSLQREDNGEAGTYTNIGTPNVPINVVAVSGNDWTPITISRRVVAPGNVHNRFYRLRVAGAGANVETLECGIDVKPWEEV